MTSQLNVDTIVDKAGSGGTNVKIANNSVTVAEGGTDGADVTLNWRWWLVSHAATHGLAVALLTGIPLLGLAETVLHAIIDWSKGRLRFSLALDQSLHLACKLLWVGLWVSI